VHYRFGSGLTLQAKMKLSPPPGNVVAFNVPSKRFSGRSQTPAPADGGEGQEKYKYNYGLLITSLVHLLLQSINVW
jgi:hypothetical protein